MTNQSRTVLWKNTESTSIEYCTLYSGERFFAMEGVILLLLENLPTKVAYKVECDCFWRTKHVFINQERAGKTSNLTLDIDSNQLWREQRNILPLAAGLFDVDFEISPSTNTLPIRRIELKIGETQELDTVWVRFPSLKIERLKQRYTRLSSECYKYEAVPLNYEARIEVDEAGLIIKYAELWKRME